jgi:diguanylate cyclase (GGDEF)-like protein/putative nucleotidyltransferase with HDIG domain
MGMLRSLRGLRQGRRAHATDLVQQVVTAAPSWASPALLIGAALLASLSLAFKLVEPHVAAAAAGLTAVAAAFVVAALRSRVERLLTGIADAGRSDTLTGLRNRRGFGEAFEIEFERARRNNRPLSLLVADVDAFRMLNEQHGHEEGDRVLARLAEVLESQQRRIDISARISGEEFAVILPDTDEHGAYVLAERLRRAIRDQLADGPAAATASFGVASCPHHGASSAELLHACDHAVGVAKRLGGDRSVIFNAQISADLLGAEMERQVQGEGHLAAVLVLAEALDMRDTSTARHSQTVGRYAKLLAHELGLGDAVERVQLAGLLHDVGKVGIPDSILQKPGALDDAEWAEMRKHPELGARILQGANLEDISGWVLAHHERPDGRGYPQGLSRDEIPVPARILAVADAYEAMTTDRVYKRAMDHVAAQAELLRCSGTQFDADMVGAFVSVLRREPVAR